MRYRRNADEGARQRARAMAGAPTQEAVNRVVIDKLRAGRPGEITLYELRHASHGLIPPEVLQSAFQDSFDKLQGPPVPGPGPDPVLGDVSGLARLDWHGADLTIFDNHDDGFMVISVETSDDTDGAFTHGPGWEIPRIRFYVNEDRIQTGASGGWDEDA